MTKQRVGVLTFHRSINYGSYWQARCLVEGLRASGHDAELLDHRSVAIERRELRNAFQPMLPVRTPRAWHPALGRKTRALEAAVDALPLSPRFALADPSTLDRYGTIVVGSDEVWNFRHPWYGGASLFFGDHLNADRLLSYAASFGNHDATDGIAPEWIDRLRRFAAISVRDENSRALLAAHFDEPPALVLDPCLQFPDIIPDAPFASERYAILYGHSFPDWFTTRVRRWADDSGTRLVSLGYPNPIADDQRIDASPAEFSTLIAGAQAVATNFFHGCVFALRHHRPFVCAASPYRHNKVRDLTRALGVERQLVGAEVTDYADRLAALPATLPDRLAEQRAASTRYLDRAFG